MLKRKKWLFFGLLTGVLGLVVFVIWTSSYSHDVCTDNEVSIQVFFCPSDNCFQLVSDLFSSSKEIRCAFYDLDVEIWEELTRARGSNMAGVGIVMEDDNCIGHESIGCEYSYSQMHNKFCVFDEKVVLTGSLNPTKNGFFKNNNNILIINSSCVAKEYLSEYWELKEGIFGRGKKSRYNRLKIGDSELLEWYFCPEDDCRNRVLEILEMAEEEVCFSSFALTDNEIRDKISLLDEGGVKIYGTIENRNRNLLGSDYELLFKDIDIRLDANKDSMHHKFFVIDNKTVITGSANPSENGYENNDENILIIHNSKIAESYMRECIDVFSKGFS
jgi:phosphatidylserine/phosphatidylglycerophosphate/cardiolipin synthase-like enzyme